MLPEERITPESNPISEFVPAKLPDAEPAPVNNALVTVIFGPAKISANCWAVWPPVVVICPNNDVDKVNSAQKVNRVESSFFMSLFFRRTSYTKKVLASLHLLQ